MTFMSAVLYNHGGKRPDVFLPRSVKLKAECFVVYCAGAGALKTLIFIKGLTDDRQKVRF